MKIGLVGSHGTGKSTLATALQKHLPQYELGKEFSREVSKSCGLNFETTNETQLAFYNSYLKMLKGESPKNLITSRTLVDLLSYTYYFYTHDYGINEGLIILMIATLQRYINYWDFYLYLPIEFDIKHEDEFRVGQMGDPIYRREVDEWAIKIMNAFEIPYATITGTVEERTSKVLEIVNG